MVIGIHESVWAIASAKLPRQHPAVHCYTPEPRDEKLCVLLPEPPVQAGDEMNNKHYILNIYWRPGI